MRARLLQRLDGKKSKLCSSNISHKDDMLFLFLIQGLNCCLLFYDRFSFLLLNFFHSHSCIVSGINLHRFKRETSREKVGFAEIGTI